MVCYIQKYVIILAGIFPLTSPNQNIGGDVSPASPAGLTPMEREREREEEGKGRGQAPLEPVLLASYSDS